MMPLPPRIDAHFHAWRLDRGDYGWLTPSLGPIYRDVAVGDWQAQSAPLGVAAGVLVQAAPTEAETAYLLSLADAHSVVAAVVGWVDWLAPDAPARIAALARHPKLKGLRPMLHDLPDPDWLLRPALHACWRAMADAGLVLDALVRPQHLPRLLTFVQRHPDLPLVIDHAGKPDIARPQWQPWADDLQRLASHRHCHCKLSGLLTEAGPSPAPEAARPWALHALRCFGPKRLLWGSDWPVLEQAASYVAWWQETQTLLTPLTADERASVLGGNAQRVYRLPSH